MQISEFQQWTKETDSNTQWDLLTTPQLLCHLTEEIGEVAQALNRIYAYTEGEAREKQRANLALELLDTFWFLVKIANKFDVNLDLEAKNFVERATNWGNEHHSELVRGLRNLDTELSIAKNKLDLRYDGE